MRYIRRGIAAAVLVSALCLSVSCGWKDRGATIPDEAVYMTPTGIPVTYTPTPFQTREPAVAPVNADANSIIPQLSGFDEPVWQFAKHNEISKTVSGSSDTKADFQMYHTDSLLYIRVNVQDKTRTVTNQAETSDHIAVFLNEAGDKPKKYAAGDCMCTVLRDGRLVYGTGCDAAHMKAVGFDTEQGYVVELILPLVSITAKEGVEIGFDIQITDLDNDKTVKKLAWSDTSGRTETNLNGVGTVKLDSETAGRLPKPEIDAIAEDLWETAALNPLRNIAWGDRGAEATFRILWDTYRIYLLIRVTDETPNSEGILMTRKDSVEVFLCGDGTKSDTYREGKDMHFRIGRDGAIECGNGATASALSYKVTGDEKGYVVELSVPVPKESLVHGGFLGLDIHVNDSEGEGQRNKILTWSDTGLKTFEDLSNVGTINLK